MPPVQGHDAPRLLAAAGKMVIDSVDSFTPAELAIVLRSHESLGYQAPATFAAAEQAILRRGLGAFSPPQLARILWAFARLQHPAGRLFAEADEYLASKIDSVDWFWIKWTLSAHIVCNQAAPRLLEATERRLSRQLRSGSISHAVVHKHFTPLFVAARQTPGEDPEELMRCNGASASPASLHDGLRDGPQVDEAMETTCQSTAREDLQLRSAVGHAPTHSASNHHLAHNLLARWQAAIC